MDKEYIEIPRKDLAEQLFSVGESFDYKIVFPAEEPDPVKSNQVFPEISTLSIVLSDGSTLEASITPGESSSFPITIGVENCEGVLSEEGTTLTINGDTRNYVGEVSSGSISGTTSDSLTFTITDSRITLVPYEPIIPEENGKAEVIESKGNNFKMNFSSSALYQGSVQGDGKTINLSGDSLSFTCTVGKNSLEGSSVTGETIEFLNIEISPAETTKRIPRANSSILYYYYYR